MRKEDFVFDHKDDAFEDYWFQVTGDTKKELTEKYMEMFMVEVTGVVYSRKENQLGVKRLFPFNFDVITPDDDDLKELVVSIVSRLSSERF